jgi:tetratricopeptide (TPR) repeat protein
MAAAYNNMAASYSSMKMWDPAIENARKAIALKPDFQLARNNLDWALKSKAGTATDH